MLRSLPTRSQPLLRWKSLYREPELCKAAIRVYTKPLFQWRKALFASTDGKTLYDFASRGLRGLDALHASLQRETFHFRPALALHYNFNGKHRTLYIQPWEERIVDLLLYRLLNHRLHPWFSPNSYAYRNHTFGLDHCQTRIARLLRSTTGPLYLVKRDISDYFASVNHEILLARLASLVDPEDYLFHLLEQRVRFVYQEDVETHRATMGVPFGTAIACLFANIYLTEMDREIESVPQVSYFRYADDILILSPDRSAVELARQRLESGLASLKLTTKASHHADLVVSSNAIEDALRGRTAAKRNLLWSATAPACAEKSLQEEVTMDNGSAVVDSQFTPAMQFRHLGLLFRAGGEVALSRDKLRKIQNLFRFAFRRARRRWSRSPDPCQRAQMLATIAVETIERGVRNIAILDYYLKHVDDERQLRLLDRWLAEEILSLVFGGHKKSHFQRISFARLRAMGLPSLLHRRRLICRGVVESPFFIWQQEKAARAFRGTVARL
ncbi:MAG: hypothetical protein DMG65_24370 [Candidatus Angelobacter sp. Gp1-AA117]|nr:MAG: hypothetical protein DMG65_24370 [Candidatus Angelobacter sp. Gp1-AA117]